MGVVIEMVREPKRPDFTGIETSILIAPLIILGYAGL